LEKVRKTTAESRETEIAQHRKEELEEKKMRIAETRTCSDLPRIEL
jgi:hypothetical protein